MANVAISGDTSGAVTLTVPATAGTQTVTFPAATGTAMVSGNMPAFRATMSTSQTITNNTYTKVNFDTETFDTNNNFASNRFTPTVAGYYKMDFNLAIQATVGRTYAFVPIIYKNGSAYSQSEIDLIIGVGMSNQNYPTSDLIYCNGTTDYVEAYFYHYDFTATASVTIINSNVNSKFTGILVRGA